MTRREKRFDQMSDYNLAYWLLQYGAFNAGYYPDIRRLRHAAEREAIKRNMKWWNGWTRGHDKDGKPRVHLLPLHNAY